jgi:O-antigen/teichoic acid export membrane protein
MACWIPLSFLFELFWRLLAARDEQHLMLRAQVIMMFVRLAGGYFLIALLASLGAAINACLFLAGSNLLLATYASRDGTHLQVFRLGWRLLLAALGMGAVAAALLNWVHLWLVAVTAGIIYIALVVLLRGLSVADFALFRRILQARTAV